MGFRRGLDVIAIAIGLVLTGGLGAFAWRYGVYGTVLFACLMMTWLTAVLWWRVNHPPEPAAAPAVQNDVESERIIWRALLDQAPGALLAIEGSARVRVLNRAARRMFATDDRVLPAPAALLDPTVSRLRYGNRSWRVDRVDVQGLGPERTLVALVDIAAEEHAAEARATRELLRVLGHEVMNAMAPIASLAETALTTLAAPERRDEMLADILGTLSRRAEGLHRFTEAYRRVARLPEPALSPVSVVDLLGDLTRLFEGQWGGRVAFVAETTVDQPVLCDRAQITQALWAIMQNGAEAALAARSSPTVGLSATLGEGRLTFRVTDSGNGIEAAYRSELFRPFFTTKTDGDGIGLAAARQIARSHGGDTALIDDIVTTFDLTIPC
ncbi:sensor histidine kinase [Asticcacaulis benevestitus]|uniref:histidine kinase n=1 Tax=Asticcacaulis benevestitus DSM 16100 = ATCC BAA-896 TaxID=1121022 RepID=V4P9P7_9CAUL|nr:ATP-binding protein [Asticcacaulis benevestitus]ESQ81975.1 hypothetical protein ABENE_21245 [Asticcacaulis benevestitus DSM 16100 = ATCC BAA-896]